MACPNFIIGKDLCLCAWLLEKFNGKEEFAHKDLTVTYDHENVCSFERHDNYKNCPQYQEQQAKLKK